MTGYQNLWIAALHSTEIWTHLGFHDHKANKQEDDATVGIRTCTSLVVMIMGVRHNMNARARISGLL
jgi:hypothetical protein